MFPFSISLKSLIPSLCPLPMPTPITHTNTPPETRAPSGRDGWLQHSGRFQITGSDRGSFNESFVCVSSQAFQAANE